MKNQLYWDTKEGVSQYKNGKSFLFDREKIYLLQAIEELGKKTKVLKVLDIGCGAGRTTKVLDMIGLNVIGIDNASNMIKEAQKRVGNKAIVGDATDLHFPNNSFDIVFFSHNGIDYIDTYKKRLQAYKEIARVLKTGGYFIFSSHIFCPMPFNKQTLINVLKNFKSIIKLLDHGYYDEDIQGEAVLTFSARNIAFVNEELKKNRLTLIDHSAQINANGKMLENVLKTLFAWERYYLAKKI